MGNRKQKWTKEEEEALIAGIAKHGLGKWKNILTDPEFAPIFTIRSNIDLKDKWRNMSVSSAVQGSKNSGLSSVRATTTGAPSVAQSSLAIIPVAEDEFADDPPKLPQDGKNGPTYNQMIFDALSSTEDSNVCDFGAILGFIEQRHEVPQNFRRLLSSKLSKLVLQGKLERVQNGYKIRDEASETKVPTPKQKDFRPRRTQNSAVKVSSETMEEAAKIAAYKIVEAENKSFVAAEAVKEAIRVSKMAEDAESMIHLVQEIYQQCSQGGTVRLA